MEAPISHYKRPRCCFAFCFLALSRRLLTTFRRAADLFPLREGAGRGQSIGDSRLKNSEELNPSPRLMSYGDHNVPSGYPSERVL